MRPTAVGTAFRVLAVLVTVVTVLFGLLACGGDAPSAGGDGSTAAAPGSDTIVIKDFAFTPSQLTVAPGTTITVTNEDSAAHTVTADDGSFDSGNIDAGQTGKITAPSTPGSYPLTCTIHPFMTGTLIVQ